MHRGPFHTLKHLRRPAIAASAAIFVFLSAALSLLHTDGVKNALNVSGDSETSSAFHPGTHYLPSEPLALRGARPGPSGPESPGSESSPHPVGQLFANGHPAGAPANGVILNVAAGSAVALYCLNCSYLI